MAACTIATSPAAATDRFFLDFTASSPDARFLFEATSPDNKAWEGRPMPFAAEFTYTLTDSKAEKVVWTYQQRDEGSPIQAFVHDSGWVVVRTARDQLLAFSPETGQRHDAVRILSQFSAEEGTKYVQYTTAGPFWSGGSRWYFVEIQGRTCFVVRTHWGRRVIMDLASGKLVEDDGGAAKADKEWCLNTLKTHMPRVAQNDQQFGGYVNDVLTAILIAAHDRVEEAVPYLREAEKAEYGRMRVSISWPTDSAGTNRERVVVVEREIRRYAQTALRILGEVPANLPAFVFGELRATVGESDFAFANAEPREIGIPKIRAGWTTKQVLEAIGSPDRMSPDREGMAWDFHMDGEAQHTVRLIWQDDAITSIKKITPPTWRAKDYLNWDR